MQTHFWFTATLPGAHASVRRFCIGTFLVSLFSVVLPGCCFAQAERELIVLIGWHSSLLSTINRQYLSELCSLIAPYVRLHAFTHSCFCNLRQPPARFCIHLFLATCVEDVSRDIANDNWGVISVQRNRGGTCFSFTVLADHTLHACFLLVFLSGSHLFSVGSYAVITSCLLLFSAATT